MKWILVALCLFSSHAFAADFNLSISNSMMNSSTVSGLSMNVGVIDPFNPSQHCSSFVSPNACAVVGKNIEWSLVFDYELSMSLPGTIDITFVEDNGISGTTGEFNIISSPTPLLGLGNASTGSFNYILRFPYFSSQLEYSMNVVLDLTYNP